MNADGNIGTIISFSINFTVSDCTERYTWVDLSANSKTSLPSARYGAKTIAYQNSFFLFGGRDMYDNLYHDLYRYDTLTNVWASLQPARFDKMWDMMYNSHYGDKNFDFDNEEESFDIELDEVDDNPVFDFFYDFQPLKFTKYVNGPSYR